MHLITFMVMMVSILFGTHWAIGEEISTKLPPHIIDEVGKIVGGTPVNPPHSRPYIAQLEKINEGKKFIQIGAILNEWTILSEAWGVDKITKVFAGKYFLEQREDSQQERKPCWHSVHPEFNSETFDYGIVHLSEPLVFNEFVQPVVFPEFNGEYPTANCSVAGWGAVSSDPGAPHSPELMERSVTIVDPSKCDVRHPTIICISAGTCVRDSGAPVICPNKSGINITIGVVSYPHYNCKESVVSATAKLDPKWLEKIYEEATKKCRGGCCTNNGTQIGDPVIPHSRPYVVQIHNKDSKQFSIGVLINAYTILTSAHKLDNILKVTAGKHLFGKYEGTQQTRRPCSTSQHPSSQLNQQQNAYSYGLIHLSDPFVLNEYVNGISIAPKGAIPKEKCSIIAWQGNSSETVLREQRVQFKDPKKCKNPHETVTCVNAGACLHDWGSPVVCSYSSKIYVQAIVSSAKAYCENEILSSIPDLPRDWLATELKKTETTCGKSTL